MAHDRSHKVQVSKRGIYCFHCNEWVVDGQEVLNWLYAIETAANEFGEAGDWEAQDFFVEWFAAAREGFEAEYLAAAV